MRIFMIALLPLALGACQYAEVRESQKAPLAQQVAEGRGIASTLCANCHGLDDQPALRHDTPPLNQVLSRYDADTLHANFEAGLKVGHPDMPEFVFGPLGADVLLTYLKSIQEPVPAEG
ncbi:MAG: c-type cytochrome [Hyphomonas sp.]|nr:c-type cytochrome [Hyphomonas sp.]